MEIEKNDKITIEYEGKLENGQVFDSSKNHDKPLEFVVGSGMIIPGLDNAVIGMTEGQEKEVTIEPKDAYGERREELKQEVPKSNLPQGQEPKVGMVLMAQTPQGQQMPLTIAEIKDDTVVLDMNHQLAGKTLIFNIKILKIEKPKKE